jgi:hypothetical protein
MKRFLGAVVVSFLGLSAVASIAHDLLSEDGYSLLEAFGRVVYVWLVAGVPLLLLAIGARVLARLVFRRSSSDATLIDRVALAALGAVALAILLGISERRDYLIAAAIVVVWMLFAYLLLAKLRSSMRA